MFFLAIKERSKLARKLVSKTYELQVDWLKTMQFGL